MLFTIFRQKQAFFRSLFSPGALKALDSVREFHGAEAFRAL
jgi:hypothetical protein